MFVTTPLPIKGIISWVDLIDPLVFNAASIYMFLMNGVLYAFGIKELSVFFDVSLSKMEINKEILCTSIRTNVSDIGFDFLKPFLIWSVSAYDIITFHLLTWF